MAKTAILSIKIISDAEKAAKGMDATARSADKVEASAKRAAPRMEAVAESSDRVASKGAQAAGALGGLGELVGGEFGKNMVLGGVAMQAAADAGDLLNVVTDSNIVKKVKDTAVTITQTAATRAAAVGQRVLNAAMRANPIGLVITAITIAVGLFVLLYKRSDTFRRIVQAAGRAGQQAMGWIVDKAKAVGTWLGKLGPAVNKAKDVAVAAFKLYIKPITLTIDAIKKLVGWIKNIKWPKPPKWVSKIGGKLGLGGGEAPNPGSGGGGGSAPTGGAGGPDGGGGFSFPMGGSTGGGNVYIVVQGAVDKEGTARQLRQILFGSNLRNAGTVVTP